MRKDDQNCRLGRCPWLWVLMAVPSSGRGWGGPPSPAGEPVGEPWERPGAGGQQERSALGVGGVGAGAVWTVACRPEAPSRRFPRCLLWLFPFLPGRTLKRLESGEISVSFPQ